MTVQNSPIRPASGLFMLVLLLTACGGTGQISGEMPLISLDGLGLSEDMLQFDIRIRNINDSPLELPTLSLGLALDGRQVVQRNSQHPAVVITARGREVVRLEAPVDTRGRELLEELTRGERDSLAYQLDLELEGRRGRQGETESRGFLHAVPGQPGRFR